MGRFAFGHLDVSPRLMGIEKDEQVGGAVAPIFVIEPGGLARLGRPRESRLADELHRGFIEAHHRAARVGSLSVEVKDIFHPRHVLGIDAGNAPHLALPGFDRLFAQAPTHRLARESFMPGALDPLVGQQFQRPACPPRGRVRTRHRDQQRLLATGEPAPRSGTRVFAQRPLQPPFDEAALGAIHRRSAHSDHIRNDRVRMSLLRGQQNLCPLDPAHPGIATAGQLLQSRALPIGELHPVSYVHRRLPRCCGDSRSWNAHDVDPPPHPRLGSPSARGNIWHSSMPIPRSMGALRLRPTCSATSRSPHRVFTRWCSVWSVADSCAAPRGVPEVSKCSWPQRRFLSCADRPEPIDQNHCAEVLGRVDEFTES